MEMLVSRGAGLDVHKLNVVACVRLAEGGAVRTEVRTFETTTKGLIELGAWLDESGCTHAVMESTGVYWKPVWHVLSRTTELNLLLANAQHVRNVPGRKSDVNDATWLSELLAHGLLRASFVPSEMVYELRDMTRTRKQLVREVSQHSLRVQKILEDCNIKLASVVTDVLGVSGRRILDAIVAGESDPEALASLGAKSLKCTRAELVESLRGFVTPHHRFMLRQHLGLIDRLNESIAAFDAQLGEALGPFEEAVARLDGIPGVDKVSARVIVSEIGFDMSRFPTVGHLISWAGLCPRMDESAGKHRSTRTRKGDPWLKTLLTQCAHAAKNKKDSYLRSQYYRIRSRRGPKKAAVAVAASILTAIYFILRDDVTYIDLGPEHFDRLNTKKTVNRLVHRLERLGFTVDIKEAA